MLMTNVMSLSPETNILADGLIERTLSMLYEIESKTVQKLKKVSDRRKRSKTEVNE